MCASRRRFVRADSIAMAIELARAKPLFDQIARAVPAIPRGAGLDPRVAGGHAARQGSQRGRSRSTTQGQPGLRQAVAPRCSPASTTPSRKSAMFLDANYVAADHQAARLRRRLSLHRAAARPAGAWRNCARRRPASAQFADSRARRLGVQIAFALMYTVIALIVLLSAVWIGLNFANRLVAPIRRLIGAAKVVSTGNLYVQVPIRRSEGDLAQLGETFNKMTQELRTQRDDIVRARDLIDSRRRFTEAVLAGASAGVIGVDAEGRISILNRSAERLIGQLEAEALGRPLDRDRARARRNLRRLRSSGMQRLVQGQVTINRNGRERNLSVRVTSEQSARRRARLRRHARRHHRSRHRAAHLGLGRRRAPHRPRDQESAHADPAFGRAAAAQVRQVDHRGSGRVPAMHRHDRAPGRRHQAHGRRVLAASRACRSR